MKFLSIVISCLLGCTGCQLLIDNSLPIDTKQVKWQKINPISDVQSISTTDNTLLFTTNNRGLWKSDDAGLSIVRLNNAPSTISSIAVAGNTLIIAANYESWYTNRSLFRSTDKGNFWTKAQVETVSYLPSMEKVIKSGNILYSAGAPDALNNALLMSLDNGVTWTIQSDWRTESIKMMRNAGLKNIASVGSKVYMMNYDIASRELDDYGESYISSDSGRSWKKLDIKGLSVIAANNWSSFGIVRGKVFRSENNFQTSTAVLEARIDGFTNNAIALYVQGATVIVGTKNEAFISVNNGENWILSKVEDKNTSFNTFAVLGEYMYAATTDGLYKAKIQ